MAYGVPAQRDRDRHRPGLGCLMPRWRPLLVAWSVLGLFVFVSSASATNVSGTISTNTTWTVGGSPYVMTGNVTVASGVTLTINAGVTVQGNASTRVLTV